MSLRRLRTKLLVLTALSLVALLSLVQYWQHSAGPRIAAAPTESRWWLSWKPEPTCIRPERPETPPGLIDTSELFGRLDFSVEDGSRNYWNRTFDERYLRIRERWNDNPLEVIVVPHSHVDLGWLKTYDEYFNGYATRILDNMVEYLSRTPDFTFIWSEMGYFAQWFNRLNPDVKEKVVHLMRRRQLEITTGGWVMVDEATTHYWSIIDQLIEGHQWLKSATGIVPTYAWSVDVFGHSSTMQLILASAGIKGSVILRTHYAIRAFLAYYRSLDFYWQPYDNFRMLCHMSPSDLYSFKHTCGPDPRVCLQYDFRKIQGEFSESIASDITVENIRPKAERLLEQYGRYASLYPHNVLLVPLGDDFRYDRPIEWEQQYSNYARLFQYMNKNLANVHIRFGTVADYFETVTQRLERLGNESLNELRGDFFPYADIYAEGIPSYWTGLYSTRPFEKALARELEHWLRSAEILYSLARPAAVKGHRKRLDADYAYVMGARHSLHVFQHHDAITGTSKREVMHDYRRRLHFAVEEAMGVITHSAEELMISEEYLKPPYTSKMYIDVARTHAEALLNRIATSVPSSGRKILLFNSLTHRRKELVRVKIKSPYIAVLDKEGKKIPSQVNPVWNVTAGMLSSVYEILFVCDIEPLAFVSYTLVQVRKDLWDVTSKAEVSLLVGDDNANYKRGSFFSFKDSISDDIIIKTPSINAKFNRKGLLKELYFNQEGKRQKVELDFYVYMSTPHRSGAYLFHPTPQEPIPLLNFTEIVPMVRVVKGRLVSEVTYTLKPLMTLTTSVYHYDGAPNHLDLHATYDISRMKPGVELVMRIQTDITNNGNFFTDSNGFQMLRRKYVTKLPVQGNVYPVTSTAYIEDDEYRLSVLTSHSVGLVSPAPGRVELMVDRRMEYDDFRGLGEGVLDNRVTSSKFRVLVEATPRDSSSDYPLLTTTAYESSSSLLYPVITFVVNKADAALASQERTFAPREWPSGVDLLNLRTVSSEKDYFLPSNVSLLVAARRDLSCENTAQNNEWNSFNVRSFLSNVAYFEPVSLTGVRDVTSSQTRRTFQTYNITFNGG